MILKLNVILGAITVLLMCHNLAESAVIISQSDSLSNNERAVTADSESDSFSYPFKGSREGWKTSGNGYFIYNTSSSSGKLNVFGIFSTVRNSDRDNTILTAYDGNGFLVLTFGTFYTLYNKGYMIEWLCNKEPLGYCYSSTNFPLNDGSAYPFLINVDQSVENSTLYRYNVNLTIYDDSIALHNFVNFTSIFYWDLNSVTLNIGGHNTTSPLHENYDFFEGCLSNFIVEDVDIIQQYFDEYPNNVNPVRNPFPIGNFSNVPQTCDESLTTSDATTPETLATSDSTTPEMLTTSKSMKLESSLRRVFLISISFLFLCIQQYN